jgi:predicted NUDIX family NTP pyrophosphohydrolase
MPTRSAGVVVYRPAPGGGVEVLLVHPGGPFWAARDVGAWSFPKGELEDDEDPLAATEREFAEELGVRPPSGPRLVLGELRQPSGKRVRLWAVRGDVDTTAGTSNEVELVWPPRSGRT